MPTPTDQMWHLNVIMLQTNRERESARHRFARHHFAQKIRKVSILEWEIETQRLNDLSLVLASKLRSKDLYSAVPGSQSHVQVTYNTQPLIVIGSLC